MKRASPSEDRPARVSYVPSQLQAITESVDVSVWTVTFLDESALEDEETTRRSDDISGGCAWNLKLDSMTAHDDSAFHRSEASPV